jgi:tRNA threonylcarbamoyladenosine biosynthesis protein TsaE
MDSKFSLKEIDDAAAGFIQHVKRPSVVAFHGEMGAGKTTFINAVCRQLQVTDTVSSPTFAIINQYKIMAGNTLYHLDLYRIKNEEEAILAGVEDCLYSGEWCFVEWPEKIPSLLPSGTVHCYLAASGKSERKLQIKL